MPPIDYAALSYHTVLFAIYSLMGWMLETIYRTASQRKIVNAGFLFGPFIPIYGIGAATVLLISHLFDTWHAIWLFIFFGLALSLVEYVVGFLAEKLFGLTLWDYSENRFNLHGRICLPFSLAWAFLALVFIYWIHPGVSDLVVAMGNDMIQAAALAYVVYFFIDYTCSVFSLAAFRKRAAYLVTEYVNLSGHEIENIMRSISRHRGAFPALNRYISDRINHTIRTKVSALIKPMQEKIFMEIEGRKPFEDEYYEIIADIENHEVFLQLKNYFHHNSSIYHHVHDVAYLTYRICKTLKLDYRSATRGALLHDFFLYDWRNHDAPDLPRHKFHGFEHPKIALENARRHFVINDIEADVISKHMWPLTLPPPRYKESYVVSFADKYLSSTEFIDEYSRRINHQVRKFGKFQGDQSPEDSNSP